jgi:O-antigen/teichoic acid export membrane protein
VAPLIAVFFKEPRVTAIIVALSLLFLFDSIQVVPYALLQRSLQFRRLAIVSFVQIAVTSIVLAAAVSFRLGPWSLVASKLAGELAVTILLLIWQPYSVAWPSGIRQLARPLLQGWRNLAARFAWYGYSNADQTIIGRVLGADSLGAYSFAASLSAIPQQEIGGVVSRVIPGLFSEVQARRGELRRYFLLLTEFVTVLSFPIAFGLALTADLVVPLALGDQWDAVVVPLRLLCFYSAYLSSQMMLSHVLIWTGQFRVNMWCSILAGIAMPLVLLWAVRYGLAGIGWAWVLVFPAANIPAFVYAFRTVQVTTRNWLNACTPAAVASALMAVAVLGLRRALPADVPLLAVTVASVAVGIVAYCATLWGFFHGRIRVLIALAGTLRKPVVAN